MRFILNPDAEEFIPKAEEEHRHRGERYGYSVERGEAGLAWVSKHPDREDESVGLGVDRAIGNQGMYLSLIHI